VGRKCRKGRTAFLSAMKFASSRHPAKIFLTSYLGFVPPVSGYHPPPVNCIGKHDFRHPSPEPVVEEEVTM